MSKQVTWFGMGSRIAFLAAFFVFTALCFNAGRAYPAEDIYGALKRKLVEDGFSRQQVAAAFQPPPPPMFKLVSRTMIIREGHANYDHFLAPSEIASVREFISEHRSCFQSVKATYGIEPEIIAALLLVETHFGSYTGKTPTLAVFATFALMEQKANRDKIWMLLSPRDRSKWSREAFDKKLLDRSAWAYQELSALLELKKTHGIRPETLRGSYMGAIGLPQFLPSSLVKFGADGNGDGRIDLYNSDDAIYSTANYLRGHGWCEARSASDREAVIWAYNHSKEYVRVVLAIADRAR